jgi:hypothetical protein
MTPTFTGAPVFTALGLALSLSLGLLSPSIAEAQEALPDVATIDLPAFKAPAPSAETDKVKFFYLAKEGVSFAEAHGDLADCYRFLEDGPALHLPGYVPWIEVPHRQEEKPTISVSGRPLDDMIHATLAAAFLPMIDAVIARNLDNTKLRRCMATRGYRRFAVTKDIWLQIHKGTVRDALLRQAKLASMAQSGNQGIAP